MIVRKLENKILSCFDKGKAIILFGARQTGKTTLLGSVAEKSNKKTLFLDGDEPDIRSKLNNITSTALIDFIGNNELVIIDEAQRIENIGLTLKICVDKIKNVQFIASGSSSFELANKINEPLTGRKYEFFLYPLSLGEMIDHTGQMDENRLLEQRLLYGMYPEIVTTAEDKKRVLLGLADSYLYKDIFSFQDIRKPEVIDKLLKAVALQIGSEVSYNELAQICGIDIATVERYISLLEQAYVLYRLPAFSRNVRNELKKSRKIYFYDTGIRNAVISNFSPLDARTDKGALWENYLISERLKYNHYNEKYLNMYFWRTTQQQEIDYIEDYDGLLHGYEFKYSPYKKLKVPKTFTNNYEGAVVALVNSESYIKWLI